MKAQAKLFIPVMWFRYLSDMQAAKDQASMHIRAVLQDNVRISTFLRVGWFVSHLREKRKKNCLDELGFFTWTKVKVNQISVIRYHGSRRYLLWQNSPHKEEAALKNMTNMHQRIALCKFKIQWSTHLPNRGHRNGEFQDVKRYYFRGLPK